MRYCSIYVSSRENSVGGYSTDQCLECGDPWYYHKNIGPGWRARSEAQKIRIGMYPNIVLGES